MAERYVLGGRAFVPIGGSTVEHDFRFDALCEQAGLNDFHMLEGEEAGAYADRLLRKVLEKEQVLHLLSCLIVPEPVDAGDKEPGESWTPDLARESAHFLGSLRSPEDKAQVRSLVLSLLIAFFPFGMRSLRTSATSFDPTRHPATTSDPAAMGAGPS
jgi:hypothetical protein